MTSNDKDYLQHNCEDNSRFEAMQEETKEQRIDRYWVKYGELYIDASLFNDAIASISDEQRLVFLRGGSQESFITDVFDKYIHEVTTRRLCFDEEGNDWYE